ncbi:MBL fold metallo-hydrolase [uncultured Azohydromonas sp.]|jgi:Predicted exonuclease of the beta-lactamase fold involved in RNA processing|uniref:MBL fold metallo-hydrolase RNA specificity domain-containing protein n=1 Tax=uncultured Azohydromonas sp. TaxID=487342 RepID=UPI0026293B51|nr:MBL fold metallo-hydrolase [uncultured Azohydromonas sp.]
MRLTFLGAAGTVTGSKYLVEHRGRKLLVDCGLFQGWKALRELNWEPLPFRARDIDAVLLTHAHLDHSGALPLLVRQGFTGPVLATPATADVCRLLLPDCAHIQEEDAAFANRHHTSKHHPAQPLYTMDDAQRALNHFETLPPHTRTEVLPGLTAELRRAGHILGASSLALEADGRTLLFSGDLGRPDDPLMRAPEGAPRADWIVIESTYGDRLHSPEDPMAALAEVVTRTAARGGTVLVPAFAVGRAQLLLLMIHRLRQQGAIPALPVFLDSPMAIDMTALYQHYPQEHRLSPQECAGMCTVARMARTPQESRALSSVRYPSVVVSASGMATGGRVLHHLAARLPDHRNTVVLVGYQAGGTRGARLQAGERSLRMFGQDVPVKAEVVSLGGLSAHADAAQLLQWLRTTSRPRRVFITHGEPAASDALRQRIEHDLGWPATVPLMGRTVELGE